MPSPGCGQGTVLFAWTYRRLVFFYRRSERDELREEDPPFFAVLFRVVFARLFGVLSREVDLVRVLCVDSVEGARVVFTFPRCGV